ncbi:hypothetical protein [Erythrobacter sp.]|uniref:DUF6894 family protein n=1 Tax=Erythrobacter sp. TaxID=1042 RepID=UPI0025D62D2D|nr:hypothetical protein [Erythrobacter sp.]
MALFFFHFYDGAGVCQDETGTELASVEMACLEANRTAMEMWPELLADRINPLSCSFEVTNSVGSILLRLEFSELLNMTGVGAPQPSQPLEIICSSIDETHRRALRAKAGLDEAMSDTRQSLDDVRILLAQIAA